MLCKNIQNIKDISVSFFGHRNVVLTQEERNKIRDILLDLIKNKNAFTFLFGTRSSFDNICYDIVTEIRELYPQIIRVANCCKSELEVLDKDREKSEKMWSKAFRTPIKLRGFETINFVEQSFGAGRASYIKRNYYMVDNSDVCIFYYDDEYIPDLRLTSKNGALYQPMSGTKLVYEYAVRKNKQIINIKQ